MIIVFREVNTDVCPFYIYTITSVKLLPSDLWAELDKEDRVAMVKCK